MVKTWIAAALLTIGYLAVPPTDPLCFEDQPCWDCSSMGNNICGGN